MKLLAMVGLLATACGAPSEVSCGPEDADPVDGCDVIDCHHAMACDATCNQGTVCPELDCDLASDCRLDCSAHAVCEDVRCRNADECFIDCSAGVDMVPDDGSTCTVDCSDTKSCSVNCGDGGKCLLDCAGSLDCSFVRCDAGSSGMASCPNDVLVCNRPCP